MRPIGSREGTVQHVEADVPAGRAHRDVPAVDVVPEREPRAAARAASAPSGCPWPPQLYSSSSGRVGPLHAVSVTMRRRRPHGRERHGGPTVAEAPIGIERRPFAQMLGLGERLPDLRGGWRSSRTRTSVHFSPSFRTSAPAAAPGAYCSGSHVLFSSFRSCRGLSIRSRWRSSASTCSDQKRRNGTSHASSSMSGSGLSR